MAVCTRDPQHIYPNHNTSCPWCAQAATQQTALTPIPSPPPPPPPARPPTAPSATPPPTPPAMVPPAALSNLTTRDTRGYARKVVGMWFTTSITVLVPWLIGAKLMRDRWGRTRSDLVNDISTRSGSGYFGTDYLAGLTATTLAAAVLLTLSGIMDTRRRAGRLVVAAALGALALLAVLPAARTTWQSAELATASANATLDHSGLCDSGSPNSATFSGEGGIPHRWEATAEDTTPVAVDPRLNAPSPLCARIEVWDGNVLAASFDTPGVMPGGIAAHPGATPAETWGTFLSPGPPTECGREHCPSQYVVVGGFPFTGPGVAWTANLFVAHEDGGYRNVYPRGPLLVGLEHAETENGTITALSAATGQVAWRATCPPEMPREMWFFYDITTDALIVQCNEADDGSFGSEEEHFIVNADGSLTLRPDGT